MAVTVAVVAVVAVLRTFVATPTRVASGSMEPTLREGDVVLVFIAGAGHVRAGDVVRLRWPDEPDQPVLKRVVALGRQTVRVEGGRLTVDGEVPPGPSGSFCPGQALWVGVPEGHAFVVGDSRSTSFDSRERGATPTSAIDGRVRMILWSYGYTARGRGVRWDRVLRGVP